MNKYRTLDNLEESYFRDHPEEIDSYVAEIFSQYASDGAVSYTHLTLPTILLV